jgi:hypothetical protein
MRRKQEILLGPAGRKGAGAFRTRALPGSSSVGRTPHPPSRDGELFPPVLRRHGVPFPSSYRKGQSPVGDEAYARFRPRPPSASDTPIEAYPRWGVGGSCRRNSRFERARKAYRKLKLRIPCVGSQLSGLTAERPAGENRVEPKGTPTPSARSPKGFPDSL